MKEIKKLLDQLSEHHDRESIDECIKLINSKYHLIPKDDIFKESITSLIIPVTEKMVINCSHYKKKDNKILLEFELKQHNKKKRVSSHIYIPDKKYFKYGILQKDCPDYSYITSQINIERKNIRDIIELFNNKGEPYDINEVVHAYKNKMSKSSTLIDFFNSQMISDERSEKTIEGYKSTLRCVERVIPNMCISDITEHNIRKLESYWKKQGLSGNTISSRQNHLRSICNKARELNLIKLDPFNKIKIKTMTKKEGTLSSEEMIKFKSISVNKENEYIKDIALLSAHTGLRFSDVTRLTSDMFYDGWLTIKTQKTKKIVNIPYRDLNGGEIVDDIIKKYGKIEKLTKRKWVNSVVNKKLKEMFMEIGIPKEKRFTFHTLRHYFATNALRNGLSAEIVKELLGHSKIQTTLIYTELDKETLKSSIKHAKMKTKE